jgi:hypothetical protein
VTRATSIRRSRAAPRRQYKPVIAIGDHDDMRALDRLHDATLCNSIQSVETADQTAS